MAKHTCSCVYFDDSVVPDAMSKSQTQYDFTRINVCIACTKMHELFGKLMQCALCSLHQDKRAQCIYQPTLQKVCVYVIPLPGCRQIAWRPRKDLGSKIMVVVMGFSKLWIWSLGQVSLFPSHCLLHQYIYTIHLLIRKLCFLLAGKAYLNIDGFFHFLYYKNSGQFKIKFWSVHELSASKYICGKGW